MHLPHERFLLIGGGLLALYLLYTRKTAAATVGGTAQALPSIVLPGPVNTGLGAVQGATAGADQTDFSPAWLNSGDPSNGDPYGQSSLISETDSIMTGLPGAATGPLVLTP